MIESDNLSADESVKSNVASAEAFKRVHPTLYIGIGGTGKEILLRLRRRILQGLWNGKRVESLDNFPVASFFYLDTYQGEAKDEERSGKGGAEKDPLAPLIKLPPDDCLQPDWDPGKYLRGEQLELYKHVKEWLPPRNELRTFDPEQGAGQVRAISRLMFFDQVKTINRIIKQKGTRLTQNLSNIRLEELGLDVEKNEIKIVVICSVAGGTGSGTFLDMGFLCNSLQYPKPGAVQLYAVTGSAFSGLHERILANSYAALSELEFCMSGGDDASYVSGWDEGYENLADKPYKDIYLVDNVNLGGESTGDRSHIFSMVADSLFEELHDPAFRGKRVEDYSNQNQFKITPLVPRNPEDLGKRSQHFTRAYSSFGQVALFTQGRIGFDRETVKAARDMIRTFFRMAELDRENHPTGREVAEFCANQLDLPEGQYFQDFPDWLPDNTKERGLGDFPLVDRLLQRDGTRFDQELANHIRKEFAEIRESGQALSEWRNQAELIRQQRAREIVGAVDSSASSATYPRLIQAQRVRILGEWRKTLRDALYARLDNRGRGGLTYTITLIHDVRDALKGESTGVCTRLKRTAYELEELASELEKGYHAKALGNLEKAARKGVFGGPDRASCLRFLAQVEEATTYYLKYRLRALACREAARLLAEEVIPELGQASALGGGSATGASGILGEFEKGRDAVRVALDELEQEIRVLDDMATSSTPFRSFIPERDTTDGAGVDRKSVVERGLTEVEQYGSQVLFEKLRKEESRAAIINELRGKASEMMQEWEQRLPTVQEALQAMPPQERQRLFQKTFRNALPWVNADREWDPDFDPAMNSTFVVVENVFHFLEQFGDEIRSVQDSRFQGRIYEVPSQERGRLVVYNEYSGMPLNVLIALHDDWKRAYKSLSSGHLPLHNHRRSERFQRPTALEAGELRHVHNNLKLFLKGVALGVLRRQRGDEGYYEINVSSSHVPEWQEIGREQQIYLSGIPSRKESPLRQQVEVKEGAMGLRQKLLVAALFSYLAERSYAPVKLVTAEGEGYREGGIAHHAAKALYEEYVRWFEEDSSRQELPGETKDLLATAYETREKWSKQIEGSLNDTTAREANLNPEEDDEYKKAQPKRWIDLESLTDTQIDEWLGLSPNVKDSVSIDAPVLSKATSNPKDAPDLPDVTYRVSHSGKTAGPLTLDGIKSMYMRGEITGETWILPKGSREWVKCAELPDLADFFVLDEDVPPPPDLS